MWCSSQQAGLHAVKSLKIELDGVPKYVKKAATGRKGYFLKTFDACFSSSTILIVFLPVYVALGDIIRAELSNVTDSVKVTVANLKFFSEEEFFLSRNGSSGLDDKFEISSSGDSPRYPCRSCSSDFSRCPHNNFVSPRHLR